MNEDMIDEMNDFVRPKFEYAGTRSVRYEKIGDLKPRKFDLEDELMHDAIFECGEIRLYCMNAPDANLEGIEWSPVRTSDSHVLIEVGFCNKHYLKYPKFVGTMGKHGQKDIYEIERLVLQ